MKMIYGGTPINSLKVKHYELDTNSATVQPSDLQAGVTCFAKGKKMTGTGKSFEFAYYGQFETNDSMVIPSFINVVEISSLTHPVQLIIPLSDMKNIDFSLPQSVGNVMIDGVSYPVTVVVENNEILVSCDQTIKLEIFYGKDNYV